MDSIYHEAMVQRLLFGLQLLTAGFENDNKKL